MLKAQSIVPSGSTIDSPTFTGTHIGDTYPVSGLSGAQVSAPSDTSEDILATISVAANQLGANGAVKYTFSLTTTNNANGKTLRVRVGGIGGTIVASQALANSAASTFAFVTQNSNATGAQQTWGFGVAGGIGALAYVATGTTVDTTSAFTIVVTIQKVTSTDTVTMNGMVPEVVRLT